MEVANLEELFDDPEHDLKFGSCDGLRWSSREWEWIWLYFPGDPEHRYLLETDKFFWIASELSKLLVEHWKAQPDFEQEIGIDWQSDRTKQMEHLREFLADTNPVVEFCNLVQEYHDLKRLLEDKYLEAFPHAKVPPTVD